MKGRRQSDKTIKPIVVKLDDGSVVRCSVSSIGREQQPRWVLIDNDGVQYIGPEATTDKTPEAVKRLIAEWWTTKKEPGKPNRS